MAHVDLYGPRDLNPPRAFATLIVKRKSIGVYNAMLCARCDIAPLADVARISSPTDHRVCVLLKHTMDTIFRWKVKKLDISQAFLQPTNLNDRDRLVITPPPMVALPWKSGRPPATCDLEAITLRM